MKATQKAMVEFLKAQASTNDNVAVGMLLSVYSRQTAMEQSMHAVVEYNGVGFSGNDGEILTSFAQRIVNKYLPLSPKQMALLHRKIGRYAVQVLKNDAQFAQWVAGQLTGDESITLPTFAPATVVAPAPATVAAPEPVAVQMMHKRIDETTFFAYIVLAIAVQSGVVSKRDQDFASSLVRSHNKYGSWTVGQTPHAVRLAHTYAGAAHDAHAVLRMYAEDMRLDEDGNIEFATMSKYDAPEV